jgi:hypothetical protein
MIQVYSGFRFIHDSGLFRVQVYSGYRFIHDSGNKPESCIKLNPE